jgi:ribosomal-protein-alanine N-acetyltransferase
LNVAVAADYRRRKIATVLLEQAFIECRKLELNSAWLEVRAGNVAAIALYRQFGFTVNGRRQHYYSDGEDAMLMLRQFDTAMITEWNNEKS